MLLTDQMSVEWNEIPADKLVETLAGALPICFACHTANRLVREHPELVTDRHRAGVLDSSGRGIELKLILFCLLAGVFPGWSETRGATFAPITLTCSFSRHRRTTCWKHFGMKWSRLWRRSDFDSSGAIWRKAGGHEVSAELAVVSFKGRCDTAGMVLHSKLEGALGWTHVSDGQILPFTDVSCDRVREFRAGRTDGIPASDERRREIRPRVGPGTGA